MTTGTTVQRMPYLTNNSGTGLVGIIFPIAGHLRFRFRSIILVVKSYTSCTSIPPFLKPPVILYGHSWTHPGFHRLQGFLIQHQRHCWRQQGKEAHDFLIPRRFWERSKIWAGVAYLCHNQNERVPIPSSGYEH